MKKKLLIITSICLGAILSFQVISTVNLHATERTVSSDVQSMMKEIDKNIKDNPQNGMSSNPYDYIKNNKGYNDLIKVGSKALPILDKQINDSSINGLEEYLLAIASENISKVNLRDNGYTWDSAKTWHSNWNKHLNNIPENTKNIILSDDSSDIKIQKLTKLGTPALPYILDYVEKGKIDIAPVIDSLLKDNPTVKFDKTQVKDYVKWAKDNKSNFDDLRQIVVDAKK